jgi:hypothetical protein
MQTIGAYSRMAATRQAIARRLDMRRPLLVLLLILATLAVPETAWALPSELPDQTWQVNGPVWALAKNGSRIFLGGDFTQLRERPIQSGGGEVIPVHNFAALDAATGAPIPLMRTNPPDFEGPGDIIYALTVAGGKLWAGGLFQTVDGIRRYNVAAMDPATLALDPVKPRFNRIVQALEANSTRMFAGGKFDKVNGLPRARLAALSFDGSLDPNWTPSAADKVQDMAVTPDGTGLFISGDFKSVSDPGGAAHARNSLARLSTSTGNVTSWVAGGGPYSSLIRGRGVNTTGDRVYWAVAGSDWAAAFNVNTGARIFKTDTDGTVGDVVEMGDRVIIGGHFLLVAPQPGPSGCATDPETCDRHVRIAAMSLSGVLDQTWNPKLHGEFGGVVEWEGARRFLVDGTQLYIGGEFLEITEVNQNYFGRLS